MFLGSPIESPSRMGCTNERFLIMIVLVVAGEEVEMELKMTGQSCVIAFYG